MFILPNLIDVGQKVWASVGKTRPVTDT